MDRRDFFKTVAYWCRHDYTAFRGDGNTDSDNQ